MEVPTGFKQAQVFATKEKKFYPAPTAALFLFAFTVKVPVKVLYFLLSNFLLNDLKQVFQAHVS